MKTTMSPGQTRILELLSKGYTPQQIAKKIHLSPNTIYTQIGRIREKLGADSTIQAALMWSKRLDAAAAEYQSWGKS